MKKIIAILLVVSMVLTGIPLNLNTVYAEEANDDVTLRVHYHRFDNNYEGWNLWLWPEGGAGNGYDFTSEDDYGQLLEIKVPYSGDVASIGIIVRLNEWEAKDTESDRFIPVEMKNEDGVIDLYLVQSEATIYYNLEEVDLSPKFISAELSGTERANIKVTVPFVLEEAKDTFKLVTEEGREIGIKYMTSNETGDMVGSATVVFEEELSIEETYYLSSDNIKRFPLSMTKAFDMPGFDDLFFYEGNDLGATYTKDETTFRLWAPTSREVSLLLYEEGLGGSLIEEVVMDKDTKGTYIAIINQDLEGVFYTYKVLVGNTYNEAVDPYAKAVGVNGNRGMVIDLEKTNPENWVEDKKPELKNVTDAIVYELHIRDLSMSESSGIINKGKFLGLTETGTTNTEGLSTGLDHIKDLGITHIQLLPVFDYRSIDETKLVDNDFNWGYDPQNYNAIEGSYSMDPTDGSLRINEFKTLVKTLHDEDIRVVMDVVYNHTGASIDSHLNKLVPSYYYRMDNGKLSNGSGCGNETASERSMVRKMIVDSVVYWASEYHIDGFRFDLMGLHDIDTMNLVREELDKIDPTIIIYGEGWTGGASPLKEGDSCVKSNTFLMPGIGAFSDDIRDGIKGHVFEAQAPGFVNGGSDLEESVKFGIVGATMHNQIDYTAVNYSDIPWADAPGQSINYVEAHDNLTLWDKLNVTNPTDTRDDLMLMDKMSAAIFLTSQGVPFIHAGMEFLRSKGGEENSYQSPDEVNMIEWSLKSDNIDIYNYYKGLIALRKAHPAFRMTSIDQISENLSFYGTTPSFEGLRLPDEQGGLIAYIINNNANADSAGAIFVAFNSSEEVKELSIPTSIWTQVVNKEEVNLDGINVYDETSHMISIQPLESIVLLSDQVIDISEMNTDMTEDLKTTETEDVKVVLDEEDKMSEVDVDLKDDHIKKTDLVLPILATIVLLVVGGFILFNKKKKK